MCPLIAPSEIGRANGHVPKAGDAEIAAMGTAPVCEGEGPAGAGGVVQPSITVTTAHAAVPFNTRTIRLAPRRGDAAGLPLPRHTVCVTALRADAAALAASL